MSNKEIAYLWERTKGPEANKLLLPLILTIFWQLGGSKAYSLEETLSSKRESLTKKLGSVRLSSDIDFQEQLVTYFTLANLLKTSSPKLALQYLLMSESVVDNYISNSDVFKLTKAEILDELKQHDHALNLLSGLVNDQNTDKTVALAAFDLMIKINQTRGNYEKIYNWFANWPFKNISSKDLKDESLKSLFSAALETGSANSLSFLEDLASNHYHSKIGRQAFAELTKVISNNSNYIVSIDFLNHLSSNAELDNGIKEWIIAQLERPVLIGDNKEVQVLDSNQKMEMLNQWRFFEPNAMYSDSLNTKTLSPSDLASYYRYQYKFAIRNNDFNTANMTLLNLKKAGFDTREKLAELMTYSLEYKTARKIMRGLFSQSPAANHSWHNFVLLNIEKKYDDALQFYESCNSKTAKRCWAEDFDIPSAFWYGRILEKLGRSNESLNVFRVVIDKESDGYYATILKQLSPQLFPSELPKAAANNEYSKASHQGLNIRQPSLTPYTFNLASNNSQNHIDDLHYFGVFPRVSNILNFLMTKNNKQESLINIYDLSQRLSYARGNFKIFRALGGREAQFDNYQGYLKSFDKNIDYWLTFYPRTFPEIVEETARRTGLNANLIYSVMRAESMFNPLAVSGVGARGALQMMPYTALKIAKDLKWAELNFEELNTPGINIPLAGQYLKKLVQYYDNNVLVALAAYNAGPHNVNDWMQRCLGCDVFEFVESIPFKETRNYVKKIVKFYNNYNALYKTDSFKVTAQLPANDNQAPIF